MVDIHKAKERVERSKISITKRFSKNNAKITCRFLTRLRLENKSYGRIANYADSSVRILKSKDDKKIQDWTRDDIENIHQIIADSDHANSVKKATLTTLKRLYHFAKHNEIPDKSKGTEYDGVVSWIEPEEDGYEVMKAEVGIFEGITPEQKGAIKNSKGVSLGGSY